MSRAHQFDRLQLLLCKGQLHFDHVGFTQVFAYLRIVRVEFDRLQIKTDAFVGATQFARGHGRPYEQTETRISGLIEK